MPALTAITRAARVCARYDTLPRRFPGERRRDRRGVGLSESTRAGVLAALTTFGRFATGNDPHSELNFGVVRVGGVHCAGKIDASPTSQAGFIGSPSLSANASALRRQPSREEVIADSVGEALGGLGARGGE